ncbi:thioesterase family protein [Limibaculum sp. M0105]|uniref:Thioesterase family protein n=1 Tax=Thermohalobaculum xanthum TaxID=2753746 RepID=A0A8J7M8X2_9RHOB|nr:thioesterase family protein [Thermohalobaculum xanthum]MBK0399888.1 thioesterase family protein [Thermohalobaculum xanthum]
MAEPLRLYETRVKPEWIDEFEHVNVAHYITICDQGTWAFWNLINDGRTMEARDGHEYVVLETHVHYISELPLGAPIHVTTQLLAHDDKRIVLFHRVWRDDPSGAVLSATNEVKMIAFDLGARRIERFAPDVKARLDALALEQAGIPMPEQAGEGIALTRR